MEPLGSDSATVQRADGQIERLGLPLPKSMDQSKDVEWPANIADLSQEQLAEHLTWWSGWAAYTRYHVARAETNASAVDKELHLLRSELMFKMQGDHKTVTETKAAISIRPDIQKLEAQMLEADALRRMLRALLEGYEGKFQTTSREITRRGVEWNTGAEGDNVNMFKVRK